MSPMEKAPLWRRYQRFWGADVARDVDEEMEFHIEMRMEELLSAGMTEWQAREEVMRRIGDMNALKSECQSIASQQEEMVRRRDWLTGLRTDVAVSLRQFARAPLITVIAIITLALGIGANTAIFGIVHAVLLQPLPFRNADRMVAVHETRQGNENTVGPGQYTEWTRRTRVFESLSAYTSSAMSLVEGGAPMRVPSAWVTPSFFRTNYIAPEYGRYLQDSEGVPGNAHVVVLSHELFASRFGSSPSIIGKTIHLDDTPFTVVGVAPRGYRMNEDDPQLYVPLALTPEMESHFGEHWLRVTGVLKPGVTLEAAMRDMERVSREIAALHPDEMVDRSARVDDYQRYIAGDYRTQIFVLFGAVGLILLLACLNVSSLLIARVNARRKEMAVRAALGATRWRIARQLMTESLVLAMAGGAAALVVARAGEALLLWIAPAGVPRLANTTLSGTVLLFGAALTLLCGGALGVLPAIGSVNVNPERTLREAGRSSGAGASRDRLRNVLVTGEIALALMLLIGAGLFVRSALKLSHVDPGFNADNVVSVRFALPGTRYDTNEKVTSAYRDVLSRLATTQGVRAAAAISSVPLNGYDVDVLLDVSGKSYDPGHKPDTQFRIATPGYFELMGIPILRGRGIQESDHANAQNVVVINQALAKLIWGNENPIGQRIACCTRDTAKVWREVVGVTGNVRHRLDAEPEPEMYMPYEQVPSDIWGWFGNSLGIVARANAISPSLFSSIRNTIASFDATLPVYDVESFETLRAKSTASTRFSLILLTSLAGIAIVLAAVGIYGVIAFFVQQRTHEIGIRMALGARRTDVVTMVVRQGVGLATFGIGAGLLLAFGASRALRSLLYQIDPFDMLTYVVVALCIGVVAVVACVGPARRAAGLNPLSTLR
jgi:predicted permease